MALLKSDSSFKFIIHQTVKKLKKQDEILYI